MYRDGASGEVVRAGCERVFVHRAETIRRALELSGSGSSATEVAKALGCSRSAVRAWVSGVTPRSAVERSSCSVCGGPEHRPADVAAAYVYLLGMYLGDGCVSTHPRGVHRLRITLDARYPGVIEECRRALQAVVPRNRVAVQVRGASGSSTGRAGASVEVSAYSKGWACLLPQHGAGRKHHRPILLSGWQTRLVDEDPGLLLRGIIHSDGCRFVNTGRNWSHPRYSFSNRSADVRRIFTDACDRLDLRWTEAPHTVYVSRVADVARLDEFVGPKR